jgi:hypothetical protein
MTGTRQGDCGGIINPSSTGSGRWTLKKATRIPEITHTVNLVRLGEGGFFEALHNKLS